MKALILAPLIALTISTHSWASSCINILGEPCEKTSSVEAPARASQPAATTSKQEAPEQAEKPASPLDKIDTAIDTVNRIDRQGAELKRLFGK